MIYSELQATVSATGACDLSASGDPVGPSFAAKTIGYSSRFLAYGTVTFPGPGCNEQYIEDGFHTIDFSQLYHTPIVTSTVYKAGCAPYANPRLSLPAELTNVDPAWKTCQPLFYGAFDPPRVLSKANRLAPAQADPATVTPTPPPVPALPPVAQATPAAQTPAATPVPHNDGQKAAAFDPPAPVKDTNPDKPAAKPATSPKDNDPNWQEVGVDNDKSSNQVNPSPAAVIADSPAQTPAPELDSQKAAAVNSDPSGQTDPPAPAVVANSPIQNSSPGNDPNMQKAADANKDPSDQSKGSAAPVMVYSPVQSPGSVANLIVAQGTTLTENGPPASIGGKAAVYSSGSIYVDSTPVAVPTKAPSPPAKAVVAQGQTLTEGGPSANVGGKAAVYSAGSIYIDSSTPIAVPKAEDKNVVVAQGQTLSENGPSAVVGGKTALYKAGSIYYDSTPVAVPTAAPGQPNPPPVVAAGVTFAPTVQTPSPVVTNGITFAPAVAKVSPVIAGGITFAPISQPIPGDTREPVVAGGVTSQPSYVQSPNAVALETSAPLTVDNNPVLKAPDGGLIVAGSIIAPGSTTSLFGHVIAANSDNVVIDGTTHSLAPATAYPVEIPTATPLEIANKPVLKAANGDLIVAGSTVAQGSKATLLGHAISVGVDNVVVDGTNHAFGPVTAHPLETPTPLEIANQPVVKAANGALVIAGTTVPPGAQTTLFGHAISVGANNVVVDDGKTLTFTASNTADAGRPQNSIARLVYDSSTIVTTLTPGATYTVNGHMATYTGSTPSTFTEATSSVIGTTTVPAALPKLVFIKASATPEDSSVEASPSSALEYVLNGKTATAASASDVPIGGLILSGLKAGPSAVLPSIAFVNGSAASRSGAGTGASPSSTSEFGVEGSRAAPSGPVHGTGSRVMMMGCWVRSWAGSVVVLGYVLGAIAL